MDAKISTKASRAERRREQVRIEILDATRDIVLRDGFENFSLSTVADELELTKPALYYYFSSKPVLILELILREWLEAAQEVEEAVAETANGADATERMMRTLFERYRERIDLFKVVYKFHRSRGVGEMIGANELERVRPVNDMLYGGVETRLRADQQSGAFPKDRDPRLFAFNAHMAVIGVLTMKAIVESASDPLRHDDTAIIDDICQTFRDSIKLGGNK